MNCNVSLVVVLVKMSLTQNKPDGVVEINKIELDSTSTLRIEDNVSKSEFDSLQATYVIDKGIDVDVLDDNDDENVKGESLKIQIDDDGIDIVDAKIKQKETNSYAAKKTVAQGMMDIALITANANQLRYIIEFNSNSPTYYFVLIMIIISMFLQIAVGVSLIFKGRLDLRGKSKHKDAKRINNYVVVGIFLVTIINVFVASFTTT